MKLYVNKKWWRETVSLSAHNLEHICVHICAIAALIHKSPSGELLKVMGVSPMQLDYHTMIKFK